jgi:hypothetical protein
MSWAAVGIPGVGASAGLEPMCTLFISSGLPSNVHERELRNMFRFYPGFVACSLQSKKAREEASGEQPEFFFMAFVLFDSEASAIEARSLIDNTKFDYHDPNAPPLKVFPAKKNLGITRSYWESESSRLNAGMPQVADPFAQQQQQQGYPYGYAGPAPPGVPGQSYMPQQFDEKFMQTAQAPRPRLIGKRKLDAAPSSVLFLTNIAEIIPDENIRLLLQAQDGFMDSHVNSKNGRKFCFAQFASIPQATGGLANLNGFLLNPQDAESGLVVTYSTTPFRTKSTRPAGV